jgi:NAD(P)H-dependent FMN reductase
MKARRKTKGLERRRAVKQVGLAGEHRCPQDETMTITLIGLSGSLRRESFNSRLLQAARATCPPGATLDIRSIDAIPLYNFDVETEAFPNAVAELKEAIAAADGLVIASPEYNGSIPGVLKNALDWLSRPPNDIRRVFGDRAVALMGATPGTFGTIMAQNALLPVFRNLGARVWNGGRLLAPRAGSLFNAEGALSDADFATRLTSFMTGFAAFAGPTDAR